MKQRSRFKAGHPAILSKVVHHWLQDILEWQQLLLVTSFPDSGCLCLLLHKFELIQQHTWHIKHQQKMQCLATSHHCLQHLRRIPHRQMYKWSLKTTCSLLLIAHSEIAALLPSTSAAKIWEHLEGTANDNKCHQQLCIMKVMKVFHGASHQETFVIGLEVTMRRPIFPCCFVFPFTGPA